MHTQRQSYLFKNRSRSLQFSQATQREKSHQYRITKTRRSLSVFFFNSFLSIPSNSPFISFSLSTSVSVYPCCCETNKCPPGVFQQKLIWTTLPPHPRRPSSFTEFLSLILLRISPLIISSFLIVLMSVFLRIMFAIARQVANQLKHSLYYCCSRWGSNRKKWWIQ